MNKQLEDDILNEMEQVRILTVVQNLVKGLEDRVKALEEMCQKED